MVPAGYHQIFSVSLLYHKDIFVRRNPRLLNDRYDQGVVPPPAWYDLVYR